MWWLDEVWVLYILPGQVRSSATITNVWLSNEQLKFGGGKNISTYKIKNRANFLSGRNGIYVQYGWWFRPRFSVTTWVSVCSSHWPGVSLATLIVCRIERVWISPAGLFSPSCQLPSYWTHWRVTAAGHLPSAKAQLSPLGVLIFLRLHS